MSDQGRGRHGRPPALPPRRTFRNITISGARKAGIFIYWKARQHHGLRSLNRLEQGMTAALLGCAVLAFYKVMDGTIPLH